jgi:hypothetical protein
MIDGRDIACSKQRVTNHGKAAASDSNQSQKQGRVCKAGKESKWGQIRPSRNFSGFHGSDQILRLLPSPTLQIIPNFIISRSILTNVDELIDPTTGTWGKKIR